MSNLTNADVLPYTLAFKAKYGRDTTLTLDDIEGIITKAEGDMTADDFAEAFKEAEVEEQPDDRLPVDTSVGSPYSYAIKLDAAFEHDIEVLAQAAIENKRGAAVIMLDLIRIFGQDTIVSTWPVPGTEKGKVGDNMPFDRENTTVTKVDGTTGKGTRSFYADIVALSARGDALLKDKAKLKEQTGDVKGFKVAMAAIDGKINNFKSSLVRAVNLAQRMAFVNDKTRMQCELVLDTDDDGNPCVANSNKLVFIQNKDDKTKFDVITIGQFLALKTGFALDDGAVTTVEGKTYADIVGTVTRAPRAAAGSTATEVPDVTSFEVFDKMTASYATFWDKLTVAVNNKDQKEYNALLTKLNGAGSDELLLSLNTIMVTIDGLLSKPGIAKRVSTLLADDAKANAKAA